MKDIKLDKNFQPIFSGKRDFATVEGVEAFEQAIRVEAVERLNDVVAEYDSDDIPHKIRLELNKIARESDYVTNQPDITISRLEGDETEAKYKAEIYYNATDSFQLLINDV